MFDFLCGLALGTAFAPFWMGLYNNFVKPTALKVIAKFTTK